MLDILTIEAWKKTYTSNFPLVNITVPRGRPKKERFRKGKTRGPHTFYMWWTRALLYYL
jgi:hypothetical protein